MEKDRIAAQALSDETRVRDAAWGDLKEFAMKSDFEKSKPFVSVNRFTDTLFFQKELTNQERKLIKRLV